MNPGGEPERDDTGLPPVDIEIPDDARDLDSDVQAYYREQRARRRQQRGRRLRGSLAKDGIVLPLLACCLILALITGTLLTVFTATSDQILPGPAGGKAVARPSATSSAPSATGSAPASHAAVPEVVPGELPHATIAVDGQSPMRVADLSRAALVLIPVNCNCAATVSWLIHVVTGAHARPYLIYTGSTQAAVAGLYRSLPSNQQAQTLLAMDTGGLLSESVPDSPPAGQLAAILLGPSKVAAYATMLRTDDDPTALIQSLTR